MLRVFVVYGDSVVFKGFGDVAARAVDCGLYDVRGPFAFQLDYELAEVGLDGVYAALAEKFV